MHKIFKHSKFSKYSGRRTPPWPSPCWAALKSLVWGAIFALPERSIFHSVWGALALVLTLISLIAD